EGQAGLPVHGVGAVQGGHGGEPEKPHDRGGQHGNGPVPRVHSVPPTPALGQGPAAVPDVLVHGSCGGFEIVRHRGPQRVDSKITILGDTCSYEHSSCLGCHKHSVPKHRLLRFTDPRPIGPKCPLLHVRETSSFEPPKTLRLHFSGILDDRNPQNGHQITRKSQTTP